MYNDNNRYRCTIIRGKAQSEIEDLIPVYAQAIINCEGFDKAKFTSEFDKYLERFLSSPTKKTLANHRTEIAGKLFGMYYFFEDQLCVSNRTQFVYENEDLPLFFKSIIWSFQFPNGMDKLKTIRDRIENKINIKPFHFIVSLLQNASERRIILVKREIAYYVLDSKDVLQGIATPEEVLDKIIYDRNHNIYKKVEYSGKASSYGMQHISEQLNILELSNIIQQYSEGHERFIRLNPGEKKFIDKILECQYDVLNFNIYDYFQQTPTNSKEISDKWDQFFCSSQDDIEIPVTSSISLNPTQSDSILVSSPVSDSPLEIGDEGEKIVFLKEKERVKAFNQRLSQQRVLLLGKQRGLGYDIQSVWADWKTKFNKEADSTFYIEVKSTKRITKPSLGTADKIVLTRNEYLAADQHKESFSIFRVYLTRAGVFIYKIFNPLNNENGFCTPVKYNYEFSVEEELEHWG